MATLFVRTSCIAVYDISCMGIKTNKQKEKEREKMIKMKFSFSCVGKQSITSAWIINCASLGQVVF